MVIVFGRGFESRQLHILKLAILAGFTIFTSGARSILIIPTYEGNGGYGKAKNGNSKQ